MAKKYKTIIDEERIRTKMLIRLKRENNILVTEEEERIMLGVPNKAHYPDIAPTNIRLERELKTLLYKEADKEGTTLASLLNSILRERYKKNLK